MSTSDPEMSVSMNVDERLSPLNAISERRRKTNIFLNDGLRMDEFKLEIRKLFTTFTMNQKEDMRELHNTMKEIQESNKSIENSINYLAAQNEELNLKINLQLLSRKTNFEIKGVPKKDKETKQELVDMVVTLSKNIECAISKSDIKDIYRVRGKNTEQKNTPIVVETGSVLVKTEFLKMAKSFNIKNRMKLCAKHLGFKTHEDTPIYLSENLTQKGSRLHYLARDLARSNDYQFVWTSYGKVYVRKNENSKVIVINSEQQVHNLMLNRQLGPRPSEMGPMPRTQQTEHPVELQPLGQQ